MKMKHLSATAMLIAGCMLSSSCVGSFRLFNKLATWNKSATESKFLNEIIFLLISPVYAVCGTVDLLVLNTIEFWTDHNPMASNIGKTQQVKGEDGRYYAVKTLKEGYEITKPDGQVINFVYNKADNSWSKVENGQAKEIFRFNDDGTIKAVLPDGKTMDVALNPAGAYQVRTAMNGGVFWAMR